MYEGPEFRHLLYFVAIAEQCNFGKAAKRLHVSQPALSAQIKQLEDGLGAKLFLRGPAGATLTLAGQSFLSHARQILLMRKRAVENAAAIYTGGQLPFRFGYSPFINHEFVREALKGYRELVPGGTINPSSECSGPLSAMVADGRLDAALVTTPIAEQCLYRQIICTEELLICLRADDPLAQAKAIPRTVVQSRLKVLFHHTHHPLLYEELMQKFAKAGIQLKPSDFVSAPAEMQFLVKENVGFGLVRNGVPLDSELTTRRIEGVPLRIKTMFVCHPAQQRPILPILGFRVAKACVDIGIVSGRKKPNARVIEANMDQLKMFG